jgi:hypothetical protein
MSRLPSAKFEKTEPGVTLALLGRSAFSADDRYTQRLPADDNLNAPFPLAPAPSVTVAGVLPGVIAALPGAGSDRPAAG